MFQTIDVSSIAAQIDAGHIKYTLSGFLGGFAGQSDQTTLFANFHGSGNSFLGQDSVGPVTNTDRGNVTGLLSRTKTALLPKGTRLHPGAATF